MSDEATIAVYDRDAAKYAALTEKLYEMPQLKAFAGALPEGGRVLDLGCGPGLYAAWLAARGFEVDAWDASAEMVALAEAQLGVRARQAVFAELDAEGAYDGVWANFSLLHAPKAEFPRLLARIRRAGRPAASGGMVFHIGLKLGEGEGPDGIGRFYAYYQEAELEALLNAAGFAIERRWRGEGKGLSGETAQHVMMLCRG